MHMNNDFSAGDYRRLVIGADTVVPLRNGSFAHSINFDNAATTPPFASVMRDIEGFVPWYSSIHRGAGYKSRVSTEIYEDSRRKVMGFINASPERNTCIYVKNTTEAINKLSYRLCDGGGRCVILSSDMEHHSNDLPWREKFTVDYISLDRSGRLDVDDLERKLKQYRGHVRLVTVAGASNVTGYVNPVYRIASLAHSYGARILVDGAQLVAHRGLDMNPTDDGECIDYLVFSAHKMYAPFGTGVLVGPKDTFDWGPPEYSGGGTVKFVTHDFIRWEDPPEKEEAGTPNLMGAVALRASIRTLNSIRMKNIEARERDLTEYALKKLGGIPELALYGDREISEDRVGIISLNLGSVSHRVVAEALAGEGGISVRDGCFCAQPYVQKLLGLRREEILEYANDPAEARPGMVRISFGLYNTYGEVDRLCDCLGYIRRNRGYMEYKYGYGR